MEEIETRIVGKEFVQWIPVSPTEDRVINEFETILDYLSWIEKNMGPRDLLHFHDDIHQVMVRLSFVVEEAEAMRAR